ncbi:hypothetical protein [Acetobacterium sp.]|uniref:hypothetical protein n=1 Tax=Acetobacterium sp. TaxID=1872094 RepID=UPI000CB05D45|nr:hypothetical protein [Acetobacterium sp.]MDO9492737.1 hypothetical protein [Acetobacterium sp.]PKM70939.1 MAG: hypothetical protein CVU92_10995 [Firmicutes bacterium HGW-Firmicutes-17]
MDNLVVDEMIEKLKCENIKRWWSTDKCFPVLGEEISIKEKMTREKDMNQFINDLFLHLKQCPKNKDLQTAWKNNLWALIKNFAERSGFTEEAINQDFAEALPTVTHQFICRVKAFNAEIKLDNMLQALRNVWIMNLLQVLFQVKVEYTPSIFAYSMLYPYTDNYLDDPEVSLEDKQQVSERFRSRLEGEQVEANNAYEAALFNFVGMIESQYSRVGFEELYESLLAIHDAQYNSLMQHNEMTSPYERDVLGISAEKGGASVLADAYLVNGKLSDAQMDFAFAYGVLLQLCDDLQDAKEDRENGHMTIFSVTLKKWPLDKLTNALFDFSSMIMSDLDENLDHEESRKMKLFLQKNLILLIFEAISQNQDYYSKEYIKAIEKYLPFRMNYTKKLYKKLKRNYANFTNIAGYTIDDVILIATEM